MKQRLEICFSQVSCRFPDWDTLSSSPLYEIYFLKEKETKICSFSYSVLEFPSLFNFFHLRVTLIDSLWAFLLAENELIWHIVRTKANSWYESSREVSFRYSYEILFNNAHIAIMIAGGEFQLTWMMTGTCQNAANI